MRSLAWRRASATPRIIVLLEAVCLIDDGPVPLKDAGMVVRGPSEFGRSLVAGSLTRADREEKHRGAFHRTGNAFRGPESRTIPLS